MSESVKEKLDFIANHSSFTVEYDFRLQWWCINFNGARFASNSDISEVLDKCIAYINAETGKTLDVHELDLLRTLLRRYVKTHASDDELILAKAQWFYSHISRSMSDPATPNAHAQTSQEMHESVDADYMES